MKSTIGVTMQLQEWEVGNTLLKLRFAEALEQGITRYPIYRTLKFAARRPLDELFDALALELQWRAQRLDTSSLILESEGLFAIARGYRKNDYCSCQLGLWADSLDRVSQAREAVL